MSKTPREQLLQFCVTLRLLKSPVLQIPVHSSETCQCKPLSALPGKHCMHTLHILKCENGACSPKAQTVDTVDNARTALKILFSKVHPTFMVTNCRCATWKHRLVTNAFWPPNVASKSQVDIASTVRCCCCMNTLTCKRIGLKHFCTGSCICCCYTIPQAMDPASCSCCTMPTQQNSSPSAATTTKERSSRHRNHAMWNTLYFTKAPAAN